MTIENSRNSPPACQRTGGQVHAYCTMTPRIMISFLFLVLAMASVAADKSPQPQSVVTANNPDPKRLPTLGVWEATTKVSESQFQSPGVKDDLPAFRDALASRLSFPLSWPSGNFTNFDQWRQMARTKVTESLLAAPPTAPFNAVVVAKQDRGDYVARKVLLNLTADSRVLALMTVPKGQIAHE